MADIDDLFAVKKDTVMPGATAPMDLASLEAEARATAKKQVANLLQRPDQLEKVEQIRKRVSRKKSSVEAMLKTAVQSQLDGVRTGLNQLLNALQDIHEIKDGLKEVDGTYLSIKHLGQKLQQVREENSRHSQLAAAVENLKHIFTVPESVKKTEDLISEGKLLHAHKSLTDLEISRDDLLFELHKQPNQSPTDNNTVKHYFAEVERLSELLGKQLWLVLQRTLMTVRREPTIIVTVLRIIEREEKMDSIMLKRYDQTGFLPPGRPKRWRQKAFSKLEEAVTARIEGNQMDDRTTDKMWLVKHLEVTRQLVIEDLRVIKTLAEPCFPPHYDIVNKYVEMYHNAIALRMDEIVQQNIEGNEIVSLLKWVGSYKSDDLMGHPDLKIDTDELSPLLDEKTINDLQTKYLQTMRANFQDWMGKSLESDFRDWQQDKEPEADDKGFFNTSLPVIVFNMVEENLNVAAFINDDLKMTVLSLCVDELSFFAKTYKQMLAIYKEKHFQDRSQPQYFLHYMIANINNCGTFADYILKICTKYMNDSPGKEDPDPEKTERFRTVSNAFHQSAGAGCDYLLEEVFMDLDIHILEILTKKWIMGSNAVDTICITLEDYCRDFVHLKDRYYEALLTKSQQKVWLEYTKALLGRKIVFRSYEERRNAAEKICTEAEQLKRLFDKLSPKAQGGDSPFDIFATLVEVISMQDTSMMSLELSGIVKKHPDIRAEHLVNLLMSRGDVGRNEARQMVDECITEDESRSKASGLFSQIPTT